MERWEKRANLPVGLSAEEIENKLKDVYNFIGIIDIEKLDTVIFNDLPVTFVLFYRSHWVAIYLDNLTLEIMDSSHSLLEAMPSEFICFLYTHMDKTVRINPVLQSNRTNVCGLYCIFFIKNKNKNENFSQIISNFTDDVRINDYIIGKIDSIHHDKKYK